MYDRKRLVKVVALEPIQPILNRKAVIGRKVVDGHGNKPPFRVERGRLFDDMGLVDVAIHEPQFLNADCVFDAKVGNQLLFAVIGFF